MLRCGSFEDKVGKAVRILSSSCFLKLGGEGVRESFGRGSLEGFKAEEFLLGILTKGK